MTGMALHPELILHFSFKPLLYKLTVMTSHLVKPVGSVEAEWGICMDRKTGYHRAVKNLHHIWCNKTVFWRGGRSLWKGMRCLQRELFSCTFLFIASFGEYSEGVSLWHCVLCSAGGERAAEGSIIYWLNFTVINESFTSDIKKIICSLWRPWRSVNRFRLLPTVMAHVLTEVCSITTI